MSPSNIQLRRINLMRFILPIILFGIVLIYESWEHLLLEGSFRLNLHFTSEVLFFGILGPIAVFVVFSYIVALLEQQVEFSAQLETLNRSLEEKVVERTEELAARNEELARANAKLQKLDQLKSDFVSLVSHELRAPLTTLNGGLELALQDASQMPPESRRILEVMSKESQRLTHLVQTILDVSRLDAGKLTLNPGPVAILPLLRRIVETLFTNAPGRVVWSMPSNLPPVWADETYLEQVFYNLLSNASKYSPQETPIELSAQLENCCLSVTVTDHGPGIPPEMQEQIFERFQRLEHGDQITSEGWGLGLYFARSLTQAQGGELTVKSPVHASTEAPGAAFILKLPITGEVPEDD